MNSFFEWLEILSMGNKYINISENIILYNSIANPIDKENEIMNEDACLINNNIIGIADGAGGAGIMNKDWAFFLLNNLPDSNFNTVQEIESWFDKIREDFYNKTSLKISNYDNFITDKFEKEGSFSTLSVVWIGKEKITSFSIGDSGIFYFKKNKKTLDYDVSFISPYNFYNDTDDFMKKFLRKEKKKLVRNKIYSKKSLSL